MNRRLQQFIAAENITQAQFASKINVAPASISHILAGRNKPGYDFIIGVMKSYPELSIDWLLTGQGKMYRQQTKQEPASMPQYEIQDSLFHGTDIPLQEEAKADEVYAEGINIAFSERKDMDGKPETPVQKPEKQRKASKIIIFYDDGTFQEFQ